VATKDGGFSEYAMFLYLLIKSQKLKKVVEIGVDRGYSTRFLCHAAKEIGGEVISVDKEVNEGLKSELGGLADYWRFVNKDSSTAGNEWDEGEIDLIFVDGDHSFQGCNKDIEAWWPHIRVGGYMILHDYAVGSEVDIAALKNLWGSNSEKVIFPLEPMQIGVFRKVNNEF
jgi:predicted O-methyltransferase YrrM